MIFSDIDNKIDGEIELIKKYISSKGWDDTSSFFDAPKSGTLQKEKAYLRQIINEKNSQGGVYFFVCTDDSQVLSRKEFNNGQSLALLRPFDSDTMPIKKGDILYIGECDCFSNRLAAHLNDKEDSSTYGLHLYSNNRKIIKPQSFDLILFPLKNDFYPKDCSNDDKKWLRELIELKLKASYL